GSPSTGSTATGSRAADGLVTEIPAQKGLVNRARRTDFHRLTVTRVEPLTDASAAITLTVPADLADAFAFAAGQTLTVRRGEERRTYSICAPAGAAPRIGVREVAGGAGSGWAPPHTQ